MHTKKKLIKSGENLDKLCYKLNSLFYFLDDIYKINSGGCCFVASVLAKLLEEDEIDFSVIVYDDCEYNDFYDIDCSQYHYAIKVEHHIINGFEEDCENYSEFYDVCSKDLLEHYKECDWNDCYNNKRNNYIKRVIKDFYNDFTNNLREK